MSSEIKSFSSKSKYQKSFKKFGVSHKSLAWKTKEAQQIRFRELLKDIDLEGKSILDFGCGMGDIIPFILEKTTIFEYKGVDVVSEFITVARVTHKNPNIKFFVRDFIKDPYNEKRRHSSLGDLSPVEFEDRMRKFLALPLTFFDILFPL